MVPGSNFIAFSVRGNPPGAAAAAPVATPAPAGSAAAPVPLSAAGAGALLPPSQAVYVGFNPNPEPVQLNLPPPPAGMQWRRLVDTSRWVQLSSLAGAGSFGHEGGSLVWPARAP